MDLGCFLCSSVLFDFFVEKIRKPAPEHKKNLQSDGWAMWQLYKHLADPRHPFHQFSTGSLLTLLQRPLDGAKPHPRVLLMWYEN